MITRLVQVTMTVEVTVDETKFDETFMTEFRKYMYPNFTTLDRHMEHLAQMHARGLYTDEDFIEGYGQAKDMGIGLDRLIVVEMDVLKDLVRP